MKQAVSPLEQLSDVPRLGGWLAGNIYDPLGAKGESLLEEIFVASFSRGVDDERTVLSAAFQFLKNSGCVAQEKFGIVDFVQERVGPRPFEAFPAYLDPHYALKICGGAQTEQPYSAIGVHEQSGVFFSCLADDVIDHLGKNKGVVLKKLTCSELKKESADPLASGFFRVGDDTFGSIAQKDGPALLLSLHQVYFLPGGRQGIINGFGCYWALRNVDEYLSGSVSEEADLPLFR